MNKAPLSAPGIDLHIYGEENAANGTALITSRHGAGMDSALTTKLLNAVDFTKAPFDEETARSYINLEQDTGADELAHAMARKLAAETKLKIYLVSCGISRAFLDGNRLGKGQAIRLLGQYLPVDVIEKYFESIQVLNNLIQILNQAAKLHIGVHSMWPYNPLKAGKGISAVANDLPLEEQIRLYLQGSVKRPEVCLINSLELTEGGKRVSLQAAADMKLNSFLLSRLNQLGYKTSENDPYPMGRVRREDLEQGKFNREGIAADYFAFTSRQPGSNGSVLFECSKEILCIREGETGLYKPEVKRIEEVSTDFVTAIGEWQKKGGSRGRT